MDPLLHKSWSNKVLSMLHENYVLQEHQRERHRPRLESQHSRLRNLSGKFNNPTCFSSYHAFHKCRSDSEKICDNNHITFIGKSAPNFQWFLIGDVFPFFLFTCERCVLRSDTFWRVRFLPTCRRQLANWVICNSQGDDWEADSFLPSISREVLSMKFFYYLKMDITTMLINYGETFFMSPIILRIFISATVLEKK